MTGIKTQHHAEECVKTLFNHIYQASSVSPDVCRLPFGEPVVFMFAVVMSNINFNVGFNLSREKLDRYIQLHTQYTSELEINFNYTGLKIKMPNNAVEQTPYRVMHGNHHGGWVWTTEDITHSQFIAQLTPAERERELKKQRENTLLIFQSGNVILSSSSKEGMRESFHEFIGIIQQSRPEIEEK